MESEINYEAIFHSKEFDVELSKVIKTYEHKISEIEEKARIKKSPLVSIIKRGDGNIDWIKAQFMLNCEKASTLPSAERVIVDSLVAEASERVVNGMDEAAKQAEINNNVKQTLNKKNHGKD